jgi:dihydropteroate synthase
MTKFESRVLQLNSVEEIARAIARTGSDPEGVGIMTRKGAMFLIALKRVPLKTATILKQEMLAIGADSAHHKGIAAMNIPDTEVVLIATLSQYRRLFPKLRRQPFQLPALADSVEKALTSYYSRRKLTIAMAGGKKVVTGGKTLVMGIVNVTPDSFSDGGAFLDPESAVAQGRKLAEEGADILDIGGESTHPGAAATPAREETKRVMPVIKELVESTDIPISIDTRKPSVARAALEAGAHMVNDVTGLVSQEMRDVVRKFDAGAVVMHMRGTPENMQTDTDYEDLRGEVYGFLAEATDRAVAEGIGADHLVVDPGIGFGKSSEGNLDLLAHVGEFRSLGFPVMVGASRKGFLGVLLGGVPVSERVEASVGCAVAASLRGAHIVRVHDVAPTVKALKAVDAIRQSHMP